jgi:predicted metal-dependent phosphoesterase TrpH
MSFSVYSYIYGKRKGKERVMYKFDTHVHTAETSLCAQIGARDAVRLYKEAGYDGIVITDHYYQELFDNLGETTWEYKINRYLQGYRNAREEGNKLGLKVLLGIELRFTENPSDYLVFGITKEFLIENPELYKLGIKNFKRLIAKEDILIFQAHPYRMGMIVADPQDLHGVEVYNGNPRHNSRNDKAHQFAVDNGLLMSSGSDFHQTEDLARGGIVFLNELQTSSELVHALRCNSVSRLLSTT